MTNRARVLERVEEDLRRGHSHVAIQRLTTLVQESPADLDLRRRLAAVHLATGNLVEAGRWSYLDEGRDADAVAAFERAHRDPRDRLHVLRWPEDRYDEAPDPARTRLRALRSAPRRVSRRGGRMTSRSDRVKEHAASFGVVTFLLVNVAVWGLGYVALVRWIW